MTETSQMFDECHRFGGRILFLPENPGDVQTAQQIFAEYEMELEGVDSLSELVDEADRGAGCVLVVEEMLHTSELDRLVAYLDDQPEWSDMPVIVVRRREPSSPVVWRLAEMANVTVVERPVRVETLITQTRSVLRDRRRQYEIRQSIANRDQFLAMVGHELRNPLTAVLMAAKKLASDFPDSNAVEIVLRQSTNLERIASDLLEISRISRGAISFDKERIDLVEVIETAVDAYARVARDEGLELKRSLPDTSLWVYGDPVRLEQVVGNLLSNAMRYTPEGGWIEVTVECDKDEVIAAVCDSGIGIPAEKLDTIFDVFTQAHDTSEGGRRGLGLGLSLAHGIIEEHGGQLEAESAGEGQGSRFSICLPLLGIRSDRHQAPHR